MNIVHECGQVLLVSKACVWMKGERKEEKQVEKEKENENARVWCMNVAAIACVWGMCFDENWKEWRKKSWKGKGRRNRTDVNIALKIRKGKSMYCTAKDRGIRIVPRRTDAEPFPSKLTWLDEIEFTDEYYKYADWILKIATDRRRLRFTDHLNWCDDASGADCGKLVWEGMVSPSKGKWRTDDYVRNDWRSSRMEKTRRLDGTDGLSGRKLATT